MWVVLADIAGDEEDFGRRGGDADVATKGAALGACARLAALLARNGLRPLRTSNRIRVAAITAQDLSEGLSVRFMPRRDTASTLCFSFTRRS
jgi:hypothetical protein